MGLDKALRLRKATRAAFTRVMNQLDALMAAVEPDLRAYSGYIPPLGRKGGGITGAGLTGVGNAVRRSGCRVRHTFGGCGRLPN